MPKYFHLQDPKDKPKVVILEDYPYNGGVVPRGYIPNGSTQLSIFNLIHIGLPRFGEHDPAWLVHDWEYAWDGKMPDGRVVTRKEADDRFYDRLIFSGIREKTAKKAYRWVRRLGWIPWVLGDGKPEMMSEEELQKLGL